MVVGSHGHSAVTGLLGSVSVAVSAHAHCPVIVVRGNAAGTARIVVGVDDSPAAQLALGFAFDQAASRSVPLWVIRAWPPVAGIWESTPEVIGSVTAVERENLRELVSAWEERYPQVKLTYEVVVDHPARALTQAGATAQLLVVGTRGRGPIRGMLLGSVSQHLLHHCACTVAVIREAPRA